MDKKGTTLLFGIIEKEKKMKVEGTLLGKIGILMDKKEQKLFVRNIIE